MNFTIKKEKLLKRKEEVLNIIKQGTEEDNNKLEIELQNIVIKLAQIK